MSHLFTKVEASVLDGTHCKKEQVIYIFKYNHRRKEYCLLGCDAVLIWLTL
jgi:hypothetical protein